MTGDALAVRLEIRSTETRPSEETQQSVLPAMSQKFGQGVGIEKTSLGRESQGATTIGRATTKSATLLLDVDEYLEPNDLVKVSDIVASDGSSVVTRRLHETDQERIDPENWTLALADQDVA